MINLRMLALAAALFLIVPVGVIATPQSDVVQASGDAFAAVDHIGLLPAANTSQVPMNLGFKAEQVVEGHTTFVTLEATVNSTTIEGNVTVDGFIHCEHHAEEHHTFFGAIPLPNSVDNVYVECHVGEQVIVTPTIYCHLTGNPGCTTNTQAPILLATGHVAPFTVAGQSGEATEYAFEDPDTGERYFAWGFPILLDYASASGDVKNLYMPIPADELSDMGVSDLKILLASRVAHT